MRWRWKAKAEEKRIVYSDWPPLSSCCCCCSATWNKSPRSREKGRENNNEESVLGEENVRTVEVSNRYYARRNIYCVKQKVDLICIYVGGGRGWRTLLGRLGRLEEEEKGIYFIQALNHGKSLSSTFGKALNRQKKRFDSFNCALRWMM
jgi:hypothetical protein